jgi:hypothetical protein
MSAAAAIGDGLVVCLFVCLFVGWLLVVGCLLVNVRFYKPNKLKQVPVLNMACFTHSA